MINSIHSYSGLISAWVCGVSGLVFLIMHFKIKQRNEILGSYLIISSVLTLLTNALIVAYLYSLDKVRMQALGSNSFSIR